MFYIYSIRHLETGDEYIGSTFDFRTRMKQHRYQLRKGKHHCSELQRRWTANGPQAFDAAILVAYPFSTTNERAAIELQHIIMRGTLNAMTEFVDLKSIEPRSNAVRTIQSASVRAKMASNPDYKAALTKTGKAMKAVRKWANT